MSYCDCDYRGDYTAFSSTVMVKRSRKPHKCDECHGIIFVGEGYQRIVAQ